MKKLMAILTMIMTLTMVAPTSAAYISDMSSDDWAYPYADVLVDLGVMNVDGEGYFYPDVPTTRSEFVFSIWVAFGMPYAEIENSFNDVHPTDPYIEAIEWALDAGVTSGIGNNNFGPDQTLTREQAFTFLWNAMDYLDCAPTYDEGSEFYTQIAEFNDYLQISDWAKDTIQLMMNVGLVSGTDNGYLMPKRDLTNAATASLLYRALDYMGMLW